jgi:uncharacterized protein YjbJ (UPF0337 family)
MGAIDDAAMKVRGKAKQVKGKALQKKSQLTNNPVTGIKGGVQTAVGKVEEKIADAKLNARAKNTRNQVFDDADDFSNYE